MRDDVDLMNQLEDTLASLGMFDDEVRDTIVRELRDSLGGALGTSLGGALGVAGDEPMPHNVHVLDRGRRGPVDFGEPMTDEELAAEDEADRAPTRFPVYDRDDDVGVSVRVIRGEPSRRPKNLRVGHLRLPADPHVWQTLLHGRAPAPYRVHCDVGELHVSVDGDLVARLEAGQSTDVEGAIVRVRACGEEPARGRYHRL